MTKELPVTPWEDRTSNYQTEIFSNMERMQSEIDDWREYFEKKKVAQIEVPDGAISKLDKVSRWIDKFPVPTTGATAMICHLRDVKEALAASSYKESK